MSSIKVGDRVMVGGLPNGGTCLATEDIGHFNIRLIQEPGNAYGKPGIAIIYSFGQTRLECLEYNYDEKDLAKSTYIHMKRVMVNMHQCVKTSLLNALGQ